jgi:Sigma-70 region 2
MSEGGQRDPAPGLGYRGYRPGLVAFAAAYASAGRAEDVVQECLVRAWEALGASTAEIHLRPWLYTIVRNRALNAGRDEPRHEQVPEDFDGVATPAEIVLTREQLSAVVGAVRGLPQDPAQGPGSQRRGGTHPRPDRGRAGDDAGRCPPAHLSRPRRGPRRGRIARAAARRPGIDGGPLGVVRGCRRRRRVGGGIARRGRRPLRLRRRRRRAGRRQGGAGARRGDARRERRNRRRALAGAGPERARGAGRRKPVGRRAGRSRRRAGTGCGGRAGLTWRPASRSRRRRRRRAAGRARTRRTSRA